MLYKHGDIFLVIGENDRCLPLAAFDFGQFFSVEWCCMAIANDGYKLTQKFKS